jgi:ADP-heptose:LPS heptosyltransferase
MGAMVYDISSAGAVISIDNGLYHIASIMEVPTLGIFGPMPSWLWGGVGTKTHNIDLGCGINCTATPGIWECVGHPCMRGITATQIMKKFEKEVELEPWINH